MRVPNDCLSICEVRHYNFKDPCRNCQYNGNGCEDKTVWVTITKLRKGVLNDGIKECSNKEGTGV